MSSGFQPFSTPFNSGSFHGGGFSGDSLAGGSGLSEAGTGHQRHSTSDAIETYFSCITTCSLEDGECVTRCVEELREQA
ncbi:MAG TPA: hypothetical protein DDY43_03520 [Synechococcales bacterium UBA10510]|jgi:hypothetical protein|nr:hypothetical protein [Synechococcales bacterium UBA10510]